MDVTGTVTGIVTGQVAELALFLYGASRLATGMRAVAGDRPPLAWLAPDRETPARDATTPGVA